MFLRVVPPVHLRRRLANGRCWAFVTMLAAWFRIGFSCVQALSPPRRIQWQGFFVLLPEIYLRVCFLGYPLLLWSPVHIWVPLFRALPAWRSFPLYSLIPLLLSLIWSQ